MNVNIYASRGFPIIRRVTWTYASWWISYNAAGDVTYTSWRISYIYIYIILRMTYTARHIYRRFFLEKYKRFFEISIFISHMRLNFYFLFFFFLHFPKIFFFFFLSKIRYINGGDIILFDIWWRVEYINGWNFVSFKFSLKFRSIK